MKFLLFSISASLHPTNYDASIQPHSSQVKKEALEGNILQVDVQTTEMNGTGEYFKVKLSQGEKECETAESSGYFNRGSNIRWNGDLLGDCAGMTFDHIQDEVNISFIKTQSTNKFVPGGIFISVINKNLYYQDPNKPIGIIEFYQKDFGSTEEFISIDEKTSYSAKKIMDDMCYNYFKNCEAGKSDDVYNLGFDATAFTNCIKAECQKQCCAQKLGITQTEVADTTKRLAFSAASFLKMERAFKEANSKTGGEDFGGKDVKCATKKKAKELFEESCSNIDEFTCEFKANLTNLEKLLGKDEENAAKSNEGREALWVEGKNYKTLVIRGTDSTNDWSLNLEYVRQVPANMGFISKEQQEKNGFIHQEIRSLIKTLKGFKTFTDLFGWLPDATTFDETEPQVHWGFLRAFFQLKSFLDEKLKTLKADDTLIITGHSQGGALATLVEYYVRLLKNDLIIGEGKVNIKKNIKTHLLTFATPHIGNEAFSKHFVKLGDCSNVLHTRVNRDLVPKILQSWYYLPCLRSIDLIHGMDFGVEEIKDTFHGHKMDNYFEIMKKDLCDKEEERKNLLPCVVSKDLCNGQLALE